MNSRPWHLRRAILPGKEPWAPLQSAFGLSREAARLAWLRGEDTVEALAWRMSPEWSKTFDPFLLQGMPQAVARIRRALREGERVVVYGDYDVDGVTATALLVRVLEKLGRKPEFFIPNRFNDGYGLHLDCIRELLQAGGPGLFISVDCGIRSLEEVAESAQLGIDWIITDHHATGPALPPAIAVLHPSLGEQPNGSLAGVGVAFKLGQALLDAVPTPKDGDIPFLDGLLKLVALGSIADMVPLRGENALLVKRGLRALGSANGPGLRELFKVARIEGIPKASEIAFGVAPRLNAVGRMGAAEDAVRLLLTRDPGEAKRLAEQVESLNQARKEVQAELLALLPAPDGEAFDLVISNGAHKGVLGIVAAQRMRESGPSHGGGDDVRRPVPVFPPGPGGLRSHRTARPGSALPTLRRWPPSRRRYYLRNLAPFLRAAGALPGSRPPGRPPGHPGVGGGWPGGWGNPQGRRAEGPGTLRSGFPGAPGGPGGPIV